jgi:hypothetical protein
MKRLVIYSNLILVFFASILGARNISEHRRLSVDPELCVRKYGNRTFVPKDIQKKYPPLLWTFPGSGSGWSRLLIEHATGYLSGTVYGDESLLSEFPGEYLCGPEVSCIKAHPTTHNYNEIANGRLNHRCTVNHIEKAIMIIRNPFDAIFSDHNRKITRSHVGKIKRSEFNRKAWVVNARRLAMLYNDMWSNSYDPFIRKYPNGYIVIKYEDLLNKEIQNVWLGRLLDFMGYEWTTERLECAFYLANHPKVRRPVYADDRITKEEAYNKALVCDIIWPLVKDVALAHGYGMYKGITC